ncbi:iron complex outermembrane receptor protein [Novosphingobium sp. PhB165]|uniref:TonB-dependent receptor n=1 Tax=Novosphingobium sp. PhB165 TaxID=2485105 RepID=UPI001050AC09|nr:TonB-dependent receptor [Novosphingobium sp. PhB165]TCM20774.1 iron complex outermembrane receptor protein [Novosphingobium sp. PhB165]
MKTVHVSRLLAAGVSFLACAVAVPAFATDNNAADAPADPSGDGAATGSTGEIVVLGFGETRQTQTVNAQDIALLTPGTSPLKAIAKLPGVNFQSADAFGSYEWSARISLRGFNQNQLGFTLDGVPLGDMSYGNYNGLHISRAIISENLGNVTVSQGAGALGTASTSNLGGTLLFNSRDPGHELDVVASATYGSEDTVRAFIRGETGDMGPFRAYVSYAHMDAGKWKGDGAQKQDQVNAKLVGDLGAGRLTAWVNYSDRRENDYQDLSKAMIDRLGYKWDNFAPDWKAAYSTAAVYQNQLAAAAGTALPFPTYGTAFTAPIETVDDAYYNAAGLRRDWLGSVKFETPVDRPLRFSLQSYYHNNHGQGLWWTPYVPSPTGAPLSVRTTEYDIKRAGAIATLNWDVSFNKLELGAWYEGNNFRQARRYYALDNTLDGSSRDSLEFQSDPFATQWDYKFQTNTFVYHVSDTIDVGDALTVSGGWKGIDVVNKANPIVQSSYPSGRIKANDMFLPQIGAVYRVSSKAELFASYTENMRAFVSAVTSGPFSTTQAGFDEISDTLKPETSQTVEGGARFRSGPFQGSLAGYYVDFKNRLLAISSGPGIVGSPSILANVGSVQTYGFEAAATVQLPAGFSATASYAYNVSEYQDDVVDGTGAVVNTEGKTVPDSPRHIASAELAYTGDILFGRIGGNYMSKRYYSYTNDVSVGGRFLLDASLGAKVPEGHGYLSGVALEVSVSNLTDKKYVSTVGSNGFTNSGDSQTLLTGAPRQWFVTLRRGF